MCEQLSELVEQLGHGVAALDVTRLSPSDATRLFDVLAQGERLIVSARTLLARHIETTRAWRASGAASASAWVASHLGVAPADASAALHTAARLEKLPATRDALVAGKLSLTQVSEISTAAVADPAAEEDLLLHAQREPVTALKERCRQITAAAVRDDAYERIRRSRYVRFRPDGYGLVRMDGLFAAADAAPLIAVVEHRARKRRDEARRAGHPESFAAHCADALTSLADGQGAPKAVVHVHVSADALDRGHAESGELSRIEGIGPVPLVATKKLMVNGAIKVLDAEGVDIRRIAHEGRTIPAKLRTALEARDRSCVVPGCDRRLDLEIDHVLPLAQGGLTTLENLARMCSWHHAQKTHRGWELTGSPGAWVWAKRSASTAKPQGPDERRSPRAAPAEGFPPRRGP